ncbi:recombinase family protein [Roseivivax marinus]|uniref:recombinase family protein n=1 Tax=Roseivivax marinus TaxID=1379903 RepID=UPI001F04CB21|nr:recombinase family protein [Roseivivax marinus]UMA65697.1 recombinase family protein [Roseivivax marinus]
MRIAYRRVSSDSQNFDRQDLDAEKVFEEKITGSSRDRPQLQSMLDQLRPGDEIHVWSLDRLARSVVDLEAIVEQVRAAGAAIHFKSEGLSFKPEADDPFTDLMMRLLGAVGQFERDILRQRQREGIAKARAAGRYKGRPQSIDRQAVKQLAEYGLSQRQIARNLGIARSSVARILETVVS